MVNFFVDMNVISFSLIVYQEKKEKKNQQINFILSCLSYTMYVLCFVSFVSEQKCTLLLQKRFLYEHFFKLTERIF